MEYWAFSLLLMTQNDIEGWLVASLKKTRSVLQLGDYWWPNGNAEQELATAWMWAFFILAAKSRCVGRRLTLAAHSSKNKGKMVEALWPRERTLMARDLSPTEVLVDFSVHHWKSSNPVQFTAESEMWPYHSLNEGEDLATDGYSWDFYKLIVVPSQTRMFAARVGSTEGISFQSRRNLLIQRLEDVVDMYGSAFLRPFDELGAIIIPNSKKDIPKTCILWTDRGRLKHATISAEGAKKLFHDES